MDLGADTDLMFQSCMLNMKQLQYGRQSSYICLIFALDHISQIVGPDGKAIKVTPSQQVVVDKYGQPVIGSDSKAIVVPAGSTIVVPHADGRFKTEFTLVSYHLVYAIKCHVVWKTKSPTLVLETQTL